MKKQLSDRPKKEVVDSPTESPCVIGGASVCPDDENCLIIFGNRVQRCKAQSKRSGERCKFPVVQGYAVCRYHGANPNNPGGAPKGSHNALKHGAYVKKLLTDEEKAIFEDILGAIHRDFDLNESTDLAQASMAAFYYAKWHCAVLGNADAAVGNYDVLFRKQLECLKTTRAQRDTNTGPGTTPAEWAVALLARVKASKEKEVIDGE